MKTQLISIIIPVYNGSEYIEKTLDSILSQTYTHTEILLINDGSTDNSALLLDQLAATDSRIKIFHNKNNGVASARNYGIEHASGELIAFCDQDDLWHFDKLEKQIPLFLNNEVGLVYCGALVEHEDTGRIVKGSFSQYIKGMVFEQLIKENFITCCSVIIRKNILTEVGNFNTESSLMGVDDWHLWLKFSLVCRFDFVKQHLCTHIFHGSNYSSNEEKMHKAELVCLKLIKPLAIKHEVEVNWSDILYNINLRYVKSYIYTGLFRIAGSSLYQAYKIRPSFSLLLQSIFYQYCPILIIKYLQILKRKTKI